MERGSWPDACGDAIVFVSADARQLVMQTSDHVKHVLVRVGFGETITTPRCDRAGRRIALRAARFLCGQYTNNVLVVDRVGNVRQLHAV